MAIIYDPRFTEVIYLDVECYVPPEDRHSTKGSLYFNPGKPHHFLLGGVFRREFPLRRKLEEPAHFWNWKEENEKDTLHKIYDYFQESWKMLEGKSEKNPDLIVIGTGISRFDIPTIFLRSYINQIDAFDKLYETYYKTRIVDLGNVGIPLFTKNVEPVLYPKTTNALLSRFHIENLKSSGKMVWDMYDSQEFEAIRERTDNEVEFAREISSRIIQRLLQSTRS